MRILWLEMDLQNQAYVASTRFWMHGACLWDKFWDGATVPDSLKQNSIEALQALDGALVWHNNAIDWMHLAVSLSKGAVSCVWNC